MNSGILITFMESTTDDVREEIAFAQLSEYLAEIAKLDSEPHNHGVTENLNTRRGPEIPLSRKILRSIGYLATGATVGIVAGVATLGSPVSIAGQIHCTARPLLGERTVVEWQSEDGDNFSVGDVNIHRSFLFNTLHVGAKVECPANELPFVVDESGIVAKPMSADKAQALGDVLANPDRIIDGATSSFWDRIFLYAEIGAAGGLLLLLAKEKLEDIEEFDTTKRTITVVAKIAMLTSFAAGAYGFGPALVDDNSGPTRQLNQSFSSAPSGISIGGELAKLLQERQDFFDRLMEDQHRTLQQLPEIFLSDDVNIIMFANSSSCVGEMGEAASKVADKIKADTYIDLGDEAPGHSPVNKYCANSYFNYLNEVDGLNVERLWGNHSYKGKIDGVGSLHNRILEIDNTYIIGGDDPAASNSFDPNPNEFYTEQRRQLSKELAEQGCKVRAENPIAHIIGVGNQAATTRDVLESGCFDMVIHGSREMTAEIVTRPDGRSTKHFGLDSLGGKRYNQNGDDSTIIAALNERLTDTAQIKIVATSKLDGSEIASIDLVYKPKDPDSKTSLENFWLSNAFSPAIG